MLFLILILCIRVVDLQKISTVSYMLIYIFVLLRCIDIDELTLVEEGYMYRRLINKSS